MLYSLRHTFLTRLGESGCDAWTLARIAGHSNVSMSSRYVHPSEDAVLTAMSRLGGHKIGHSETSRFERSGTEAANSIETKEKYGGRDRDRTGDPLLAKQAEIHSKSLLWLRFQISDPVKCVPKMFLPVWLLK